MKHAAFILLPLGLATPVLAQHPPSASGGPLLPEQASYDVTFYELDLRVEPADSTIAGTLTVHADIVNPMEWLVLDLDTTLDVRRVQLLGLTFDTVSHERREGRIWIPLPEAYRGQDRIVAAIEYGGHPHTVPRGGFSGFLWERTPSGAPWVAVNCELYGADLWWPVKDHPSDEPDSMAMRITVPEPLVAVANGRPRGATPNPDGTRTYEWFISTPINNYNVTLNIAPYVEITEPYRSVTGEEHDLHFWVLPENEDQARNALPEFADHLRHFEELLGPYPFWADKYGIVEVPYLGMEHQTIIAYGAGYRTDAMGGIDFGFDGLHHHELAHEWFGNQVTPPDFNDLWLNESFATYAQALYAESRHGWGSATEQLAIYRSRAQNEVPIAGRVPATAGGAYNGDIYFKGAAVLHTLRYLVGDDAFFEILRRWTYPEARAEETVSSCQCRFATTDDLVRLASEVAGRDLGWFFEVYVRHAGLPHLVVERTERLLRLNWVAPSQLPFPMPIDIRVDGETRRVEIPSEGAEIRLPEGAYVEIDPEAWLLRS